MSKYYIAKRKTDSDWQIAQLVKAETYCPAYYFPGYEIAYVEHEIEILREINLPALVNEAATITSIDFLYRYMIEGRYDILDRCIEIIRGNIRDKGFKCDNLNYQLAQIRDGIISYSVNNKHEKDSRVLIKYVDGKLIWEII